MGEVDTTTRCSTAVANTADRDGSLLRDPDTVFLNRLLYALDPQLLQSLLDSMQTVTLHSK